MNNVMLVGRLANTPDLFDTENGRKGAFITLAVARPYKNQEGKYETDFFDCTLWTGIAESTVEYCKKGDTIGVRGKLQSRIIENDDGFKYKKIEVVADRVSFISSKKEVEENEEENMPENKISDNRQQKDKNNDVDKANDLLGKHDKKNSNKS